MTSSCSAASLAHVEGSVTLDNLERREVVTSIDKRLARLIGAEDELECFPGGRYPVVWPLFGFIGLDVDFEAAVSATHQSLGPVGYPVAVERVVEDVVLAVIQRQRPEGFDGRQLAGRKA